MTKSLVFSLVAFAAIGGGVLSGCGSEPTIQVQVAEATPAPVAGAAPAGVAVQPSPAAAAAAPIGMPPSHPSLDAPVQQAPPLAPGAVMPANHPPLDGATQSAPPLQPGAKMPANHPPMGGAAPAGMELAPVDPNLGSGDKAIAWQVPSGWEAVPPSSNLRRAQYRVPGKGGDAECAVFYFGPGQGGDPQSNAERWASQFVGPDGQPGSVKATTRQIEGGGVKVLFVEAKGTYLAGSMMGGPGNPVPGQALLGAIAEGPDANWFFKMTGPEATIDSQRSAFEQMLKSLKKGN